MDIYNVNKSTDLEVVMRVKREWCGNIIAELSMNDQFFCDTTYLNRPDCINHGSYIFEKIELIEGNCNELIVRRNNTFDRFILSSNEIYYYRGIAMRKNNTNIVVGSNTVGYELVTSDYCFSVLKKLVLEIQLRGFNVYLTVK